MKNLRKFLVFVLFAFATLFAFGLNSVKAANGDTATITFNDKAKRTVYTTAQQVWVENGITVTNDKASSTTNVGDYSNPARFYKASKLTVAYTTTFSSIEFNCSESKYATLNTVTVSGGTFTKSGNKFVLSLDTPTNIVSFNLTEGQLRLTSLVVTEYAEVSGLTALDIPENTTLENGVVTWDAVEGATGYRVGIFASEDATATAEVFKTTEVTLDLTTYTPQGTHYVKVKALGDSETTSDSEWVLAGIIENGDDPIEVTVSEALALEIPAFENPTYYSITGRVSSIYQAYSSQYNNVSPKITDGDKEIIAFRAVGDSAANVKVGDIITVEGTITAYNKVNQLAQGCKIVEWKPACAVGVQTAEAENGAQHIRLVGGLNVNWEELTALSLTITDATDATKTVTLEITNVFGTLVANTENGIAEITAESQGFESLFAFTITNVPAGTTLKVTATYTTETATYTSAVKTVAVPAAE